MILSVITLATLLGMYTMAIIFFIVEAISKRNYLRLAFGFGFLALLINCAFNFPVKK